MSRVRLAIIIAAAVALASTTGLNADVRSDQKTKFQFAGALGRVVNFFGGRAAREGVTSTVAVKGNRKLTLNDTTGQIIDLSEEKIYDLDVKKKQYRVMTFAEIRKQMEAARARAQEEARKEQPAAERAPAEPDPNAKQYDVDLDVKNTGEKKDINGFSTTQSVVTVTVREKGKTLQESGGLVMTNDMWMTPSIPALKEVTDFDIKYAQQLYGPMITGASAQEMASAMAMYPMIKPAMERMAAEGQKLQGTSVMSVMTVDAVKSAEQVAAEQKSSSSSAQSSDSSTPTGVGGLLGGLGKRMARRNNNDAAAPAGPRDRATIMTTTNEVLKVSTTVGAEEVAIPAGYKETK
jgi:hypothetical protein